MVMVTWLQMLGEGQEMRPEVELEGGTANDGGEEKHIEVEEGDKNVNDIHSGGKQENIGMVCSIECVCVCIIIILDIVLSY